MKLFVTPASPWVRRVRVCILELDIEDRFEFVQTRWPHAWGTQTVRMPDDFVAATPVMRIPALVADDVTLTDSHAICDYLNGTFGDHRLLAVDGPARWQALAINALACSIIEAQIMRRAELLRTGSDKSSDFIAKMRDREMRCFAALEKELPKFGNAFDLAQITTAVACGYDEWRYGSDWRSAAPRLAAWYDRMAERPSLKSTEPAETPQR
ncbi:MAG TPA: glutathione S-transferase family protein [Reyranella sp.]|nr:glutathione S-transferase family protein [Reyranella sp.]